MNLQPNNVIPTSSILMLKQIVAADLENVNQLILQNIRSDVTELIPVISKYITSSGGKRIRPILTLACARIFNITNQNHILLAAAVEFIHTATLLHDDVIDEGITRRGVATANRLWGNKASILVGDYLFSKSFNLMVQTSSLEALEILSATSLLITEGEVWQLSNISNLEISQEEYFQLIKAKTAQLFSAACKVGGVVTGAAPEETALLGEYGMNLGMAFQIIDDILDYTTHDQDFGKVAGGDFREGKITLPIILALQDANEEDRNTLLKLITANKNPGSFTLALDILEKYNVFTKSYAIATQFVESGCRNLEHFLDNEIISLLRKLIIELLDRSS